MQEESQEPTVPEVSEQPQINSAAEPVATQQTISPEDPNIPKPQKKKLFKKRTTIMIIIVVALIAGGAAAYFVTKKDSSKANTSTAESGNTTQDTTDGTNQSEQTNKDAVAVTMKSGLSFLTAPKKLENLKFFKDYTYFGTECLGSADCTSVATYSEADVNYYHVGTTKDNKRIIVAYAVSKNIDGGIQVIAIESAPKTYQILMQHDYKLRADSTSTNTAIIADLAKLTNAGVTLDKSTTLA